MCITQKLNVCNNEMNSIDLYINFEDFNQRIDGNIEQLIVIKVQNEKADILSFLKEN